ncbi:MAG: hypothetical protein ABW252_20405 [Polyangiales bacterium]
MSWRWLGLLSLVGMLGCAGLEDANPAPRCSATQACPDDLVCYRSFCVENASNVDDDDDDGSVTVVRDAGRADAAAAPLTDRDAALAAPTDAGGTSAPTATQPPGASSAPATPAPTPVEVAPTPALPAPETTPVPTPANVSESPWRWPWRFEQLRNLPSYLLGCLGSCTIVGQKECESCVAEKERQQLRSEGEDFCDSDDEDDEDERSGRCEARR